MDLKALWNQHQKAIITTAICAFVALLVIKLFDVILVWGVIIAAVVASVVAWQHYSKRYGGAEGVWSALKKEIGFKS